MYSSVRHNAVLQVILEHKKSYQEWHLSMLFFVELNKTNEVKFWLTIYSYFDVSMKMVTIIKKNKYQSFLKIE